MLDVAKIGPIPKFQGLALGGNKIEKKSVIKNPRVGSHVYTLSCHVQAVIYICDQDIFPQETHSSE